MPDKRECKYEPCKCTVARTTLDKAATAEDLEEVPGIGTMIACALVKEGIDSPQDLLSKFSKLSKDLNHFFLWLKGVVSKHDLKSVNCHNVVQSVQYAYYITSKKQQEYDELKGRVAADQIMTLLEKTPQQLTDIPFVGEKMASALQLDGIQDVDELTSTFESMDADAFYRYLCFLPKKYPHIMQHNSFGHKQTFCVAELSFAKRDHRAP